MTGKRTPGWTAEDTTRCIDWTALVHSQLALYKLAARDGADGDGS